MAPTHVTLGAFFGGADARLVRDGSNEQFGEADFRNFNGLGAVIGVRFGRR